MVTLVSMSEMKPGWARGLLLERCWADRPEAKGGGDDRQADVHVKRMTHGGRFAGKTTSEIGC